MSEIRNDELLGNIGSSNPLLYASCGVAWLSLGDLVNDSVDPLSLRTGVNPTPAITEFHISTETEIGQSVVAEFPVKHRKVSSLWMASWIKQTSVSDSGITPERRYSLRIVEDTELLTVKHENKRSRAVSELLIGERSVLWTYFSDQVDSTELSQTYDISEELSAGFISMIDISKIQQAVKPVLDYKRTAKQQFRDGARKLQGIDPSSDLTFDNHGNAFFEGKAFAQIVNQIRRQADTSNDRRLMQIWGGRPLLSDRYHLASQISRALTLLV